MAEKKLRVAFLSLIASMVIAACTPEESAPETAPGTRENSAPSISGVPATIVAAGTAYNFQPGSSDADGDSLTFSIAGKPSWAAFATTTGRLSGTPTTGDTGAYGGIVITVSDGSTARSLGPFSITVTATPQVATGSASLNWSPPVQYTDGSALSAAQLAGYRIYHGADSGHLSLIAEIDGGSSVSHTVRQLTAGTHFFAVTAVSAAGVESAWSQIGSKIIL